MCRGERGGGEGNRWRGARGGGEEDRWREGDGMHVSHGFTLTGDWS